MPKRAGAPLKKTPPTTVRLFQENHVFVKAQAENHPDGQSGVINDALDHYRRHIEQRNDKLYAVIFGATDDK